MNTSEHKVFLSSELLTHHFSPKIRICIKEKNPVINVSKQAIQCFPALSGSAKRKLEEGEKQGQFITFFEITLISWWTLSMQHSLVWFNS